MKVMNKGAQMHTPMGMIDRGESEVKDWDKMKQLPKVKAALASKRLVEGGVKTEPKKVEKKDEPKGKK